MPDPAPESQPVFVTKAISFGAGGGELLVAVPGGEGSPVKLVGAAQTVTGVCYITAEPTGDIQYPADNKIYWMGQATDFEISLLGGQLVNVYAPAFGIVLMYFQL